MSNTSELLSEIEHTNGILNSNLTKGPKNYQLCSENIPTTLQLLYRGHLILQRKRGPKLCQIKNSITAVKRNKDKFMAQIEIKRSGFQFISKIYLPLEGYILVGVLAVFTIITIVLYIEEICFVRRYFPSVTRTLWLLACYPIFSITGLIGVVVPRAGPLIDLMANTFFATCLFNFGFLMVSYMGGPQLLWSVIEPGRKVRLTMPPCGCFFFCIGSVDFQKHVFMRIRFLVMQVAIVRPILMFFAVALWADGSYQPGHFGLKSPFTYVMIGNVISTMTAVYGLMLFKNTFDPELGSQFLIGGKILCVQLTLVLSLLPALIIGILVKCNVIACSPMFPSKARGDSIFHGCLILIMLPLSLLAQKFFRRTQDAIDCGREMKKQADWVATLKNVDNKEWLSMGETKV